MESSTSSRPIVNELHPRQDINRERLRDRTRPRYRFAGALLPWPSPGATLCDVGGGAGEFCDFARERGYKTLLLDGNENSIAAEAARGQAALRIDLTSGLQGVANESQDVVVCLEVIEHIVTSELLVREIARILKPNGIAIISTPNFGFLRDRLRYLLGDNVKEEGYHFRFYVKHSLEAMLAAARLRVDRRNSMGSALGVNFLLRILSLGRLHVRQFPCPGSLESWMAETFVWRVRKAALDDARHG